MLPSPSAEYTAQEALDIGSQLAVRITFLPYPWPLGVNANGDFSNAYHRSPDRIQANYEGFASGYWISEVLTSNLQVAQSTAVFTWDWNYPGFDAILYWRAADSEAELASESWTEVSQGGSLQVKAYYQLKAAFAGYRCWIEEEADSPDDWTAWAEMESESTAYKGFAANVHVSGDMNCYIENLQLIGEFTVVRDIERAGTVVQEAPKDFSSLVAGSHDGLELNNRQGSFNLDSNGEVEFVSAPLFSPGRSSFFLAHKPDWYGTGAGDGLKLRIDIGWNLGGFLQSPFLPGNPMLQEGFTDFLTLYLGKVEKPFRVNREVDEGGLLSPSTVEVYSVDFIMDCLQKRICLPSDDGSPQPLTMGEFLVKGEAISGWSPAPVVKSAYFDNPNYNELDHVVSSGGGAFSLVTPGIGRSRLIRFSTTGANQEAYGSMELSSSGEMFATGVLRFVTIPGSPANLNFTFMRIIDSTGSPVDSLSIDDSGNICSNLGGQTDFNILGYEGVPLTFGLWLSPANPGYVKLFINADEVLSYSADLSGETPVEFRMGAETQGVAETWDIDFEAIEVRSKYYMNAYRVTGAPFNDIGAVYLDNIAQPASKTVGGFTQTMTKYPEYGMVQFASTDPEFEPSSDVLMRVVENSGGRHALYGIETILDLVGLTDYINTASLAAAYVARPNDIVHMRFEGEEKDTRIGLKDYGNLGIKAADCLREITSRMMYWIFLDAGEIKIVPYDGSAPSSPAMAFDSSNMHEASQEFGIGNEEICAYVASVYGWYDRNPSLFYVAGDPGAGYQGKGLDYSWGNSPVVCESLEIVKEMTDLFLQFLSANERLNLLRTKKFQAARLELMTDAISVEDELLHESPVNYRVQAKEIALDAPREVTLRPIRFLGDN